METSTPKPPVHPPAAASAVPVPAAPARTAAPSVAAAASPTPKSLPPGLSRPAQTALGLCLVLTLALLAFRGYGNKFGTHPTERVAAPITDLNRAGRAELEQVPGIGPTLAKAIEEHRTRKGSFKSVDELRLVKGVGSITLDKVRPYLLVELSESPSTVATVGDVLSPEPLVLERKPTSPAPMPARSSGNARKLQPGDPPIDLNAAGIDDLARVPGIGPVTAQHILMARAAGPFASVADLGRVKGIGAKTLEKIRPFVVVK